MWVQAASTCHFWRWVWDYLLQGPEFLFTMSSDSNVSSKFPRNGKVHSLGGPLLFFFFQISSLPVLEIRLLWSHKGLSFLSLVNHHNPSWIFLLYWFTQISSRLVSLQITKYQLQQETKNNPENEELNLQMSSYLFTGVDSRSCSMSIM